MERKIDPDVQLLQALADSTRLAIVRQLGGAPETCACDLTSCCGVRQPTVSHHLKVLREAGVVVGERRGTWIWYRLAPGFRDRLDRVGRSLDTNARALPMAAFVKSPARLPRGVETAVEPGGPAAE